MSIPILYTVQYCAFICIMFIGCFVVLTLEIRSQSIAIAIGKPSLDTVVDRSLLFRSTLNNHRFLVCRAADTQNYGIASLHFNDPIGPRHTQKNQIRVKKYRRNSPLVETMAYVLTQINKSIQYYLLEYSGKFRSHTILMSDCFVVVILQIFWFDNSLNRFRCTIRTVTNRQFTVASIWYCRRLFVFCVVVGTASDGKIATVSNKNRARCV